MIFRRYVTQVYEFKSDKDGKMDWEFMYQESHIDVEEDNKK